jgi:hypothetical protein
MPCFPVRDTVKYFREIHSFQKYESLEVYICWLDPYHLVERKIPE